MSLNDSDDRRSPDLNYGSWKFVEEITFEDLLAHPVWVWCMEVDKDGGPDVGSEATMRPLLNTVEIPLDHISPPLILLKIQGTDFYASGIYDQEQNKLESIGVFVGNYIVHPDEVKNLTEPVIYLSVPTINGINVAFERSKAVSDEAILSA
jgi:hypothetical protein